MEDRNAVYDYKSKNEELKNNHEEAKDENEIKVVTDGCINKIIIKPNINITSDIEGLETNTFVTAGNDEMEDNNLKHNNGCKNDELDENIEIKESVNCIIIKPVVKVDVNISGLNTTITM